MRLVLIKEHAMRSSSRPVLRAATCGAAALMLGLMSTASPALAVDVTGAGSSFAAPIYIKS